MDNKKCSRRKILKKELINDWDELNISFKALILIGLILFGVVISITLLTNGGEGTKGSIEIVFRTTFASVFGFLLSSNIKNNNEKVNAEINRLRNELKNKELPRIELENSKDKTYNKCKILEEEYTYNDINVVQIIIALLFCIISTLTLCILLTTNNLENMPAITQIRDLMCNSIGFLIGECGKK